MDSNLAKRFVAEFTGTAMLLAAIVGSGIMAERLSGGNSAVALLANTIAIAAALAALIFTFGPVSGAHFNPAVTIADAIQNGVSAWTSAVYIAAQVFGALVGVGLADLMFDLPIYFASTKMRTGIGQWVGEFVATFGLLGVIWSCSRLSKAVVPFVVASYIGGAIWFTSSTSFANPAVTIARSMSDTFTGIRPIDIFPFIAAQLAGAFAATILFKWLMPIDPERVVVPHEDK
jgi:glycerol uptake facilitator-like aquaporin